MTTAFLGTRSSGANEWLRISMSLLLKEREMRTKGKAIAQVAYIFNAPNTSEIAIAYGSHSNFVMPTPNIIRPVGM